MKVVSIGDLVLDYYYQNGELIGVNGGMTSHNIIANLAKMGINTYFEFEDLTNEEIINKIEKI